MYIYTVLCLTSLDENLSIVFLGQRVCTFYFVIYTVKLTSTDMVSIDISTNSESPFLSPTLGTGVFIYVNIIGDQ